MKVLVKMKQLCSTDQTMYAVDEQGYIWFVNMKTGEWEMHGSPTTEMRSRMLGEDM